MTRRGRRRGPPQCKECHRTVAWFRWEHSGSWRTFDPRPVEPRTMHATAYPVEGGRVVWRFRDLVEDLMVRRQVGEGDAEAEARDMPWHIPHTCPTPEPDADEGDLDQ